MSLELREYRKVLCPAHLSRRTFHEIKENNPKKIAKYQDLLTGLGVADTSQLRNILAKTLTQIEKIVDTGETFRLETLPLDQRPDEYSIDFWKNFIFCQKCLGATGTLVDEDLTKQLLDAGASYISWNLDYHNPYVRLKTEDSDNLLRLSRILDDHFEVKLSSRI
jgi:hypothetical protein